MQNVIKDETHFLVQIQTTKITTDADHNQKQEANYFYNESIV